MSMYCRYKGKGFSGVVEVCQQADHLEEFLRQVSNNTIRAYGKFCGFQHCCLLTKEHYGKSTDN